MRASMTSQVSHYRDIMLRPLSRHYVAPPQMDEAHAVFNSMVFDGPADILYNTYNVMISDTSAA